MPARLLILLSFVLLNQIKMTIFRSIRWQPCFTTWFCFLMLFSTCFVQKKAGKSDMAKKTNEYLRAYEANGYSGSIILAEKGAITLYRAYGKEIPRPSLHHIWTIGSITKPLTATAILQLAAQSKISLNAPIGSYIPKLNEDKGALTVHQLLTHTAGLGEYSGQDDAPMSKSLLIDFVNKTPFKAKPGHSFFYSNVGYSLLGILIEEVSNLEYETYLSENIFKPAGMHQTGYILPEWDTTLMAIGFRHDGKKWGYNFHKNAYKSPDGISWNLKANGGILSTPHDMYKWHNALQSGLLLSSEMKEKMFAPHIQTPKDFNPFHPEGKGHYGYGWAITKSIDNKTIILHGGSNDVFEAGYMYYPDEDVFLFITSNRAAFPASGSLSGLDKIISRKNYALPQKAPNLNEKMAANYIGNYIFEDSSKVRITKGDDRPFKNSLIVRPLNKGGYHKIVGKPLDTSLQIAAKEFIMKLLQQSRQGEAFPLRSTALSTKASVDDRNQYDEDTIIGVDPNTDLHQRQRDFWTEHTSTLGPFLSREFWAAVGVHDKIYACAKISFENGDAFLNYSISNGTIERITINNRPIGLVLKPKSKGRFVEVNNQAPYLFHPQKNGKSTLLKITIHGQVFVAAKG